MSVRGPPPLEILHEALAAGEALSPELWRRLGRELGRASAALRAARAFHFELGGAPQERSYVGTSCFLRGALPPGSTEQAADCLGYCDQSPCRMDPQGRVFGRAGGALPAARPSVRCSASEAVVTARLIRGDASGLAAARREGVYETLERALEEPADAITTAVERSGERGRGQLSCDAYVPSPESDVEGRPWTLITGRVLHQYNVGSMTRRTPSQQLASADELEIAPEDAAAVGVADGGRVEIESRWGRTEVAVRLSRRVQAGQLFLSFHHPESHANAVTGPYRDESSDCPEYKLAAVTIRAVTTGSMVSAVAG